VKDEELIRQWRSLRDIWNGPPRLNHQEQRVFVKNRNMFEDWHPEDWEVVREFLAAKHPQGSSYTVWVVMKAAMANSAGLLAHARSWKSNQRPKFEVVLKSGPVERTAEDVEAMAEFLKPRRVNS
jgi:hypothetical protein